MLDKLASIREKYALLEEQLSDPEVISDIKRYARIHKEYKDMGEVVRRYDEYQQVTNHLASARSLEKEEDDQEVLAMVKEEIVDLEARQTTLEEEIRLLLIPKDPEDAKDVIFEIRSGTGGDEASIFAGDLYRMYSKYFERQGWTVETISASEGSVGGFKEVVLEVSGQDVYGRLKFESGAHRVQRVPKTESQGRVHTSAATVAVMPKLEMEDINIRKDELRVDTFRSSGAGGQHVNKTESGVRFTHLPTGIVAESMDSRSQIKNREIALQRLYNKIVDAQRQKHESDIASRRKSLVGTGDRSDKIRTYNYPQNRVTDHRINLTLYNLDSIVNGDLVELIEALQIAENMDKLQAMESV